MGGNIPGGNFTAGNFTGGDFSRTTINDVFKGTSLFIKYLQTAFLKAT